VQTRPDGRYSRFTCAPGIALSMSVCPNPLAVGVIGRGPSVSVQTTLSMCWLFRGAVVQTTLTVPEGADSEPYFAALVASSCSTTQKGVARLAGNDTGSPSSRNRFGLSVMYGASCSRASSPKSAPSHSEPTRSVCADASADNRPSNRSRKSFNDLLLRTV